MFEENTNDNRPRVQIPLGADRPGLTIDGEFRTLWDLPADARDAYVKYAEQGGNVRIYQCDRCGYLTQSDAFSASSYNKAYECGNCGARLKGTTQHGSNESATQVHGPYVEHDDENHVDVLGVEAEQNCPNFDAHGPSVEEDEMPRYGTPDVNEAAVACDQCVPNHPSHLGRLQNEVSGEITQGEMIERVADAVEAFREA